MVGSVAYCSEGCVLYFNYVGMFGYCKAYPVEGFDPPECYASCSPECLCKYGWKEEYIKRIASILEKKVSEQNPKT